MFRIMLTDQAEENLGRIPSPVYREQVARGIELLARHPDLGRPAAYFPGVKLYRTSSVHYLVLFRVIESNRTLVVIAILAGHGHNLNLVEPFSTGTRNPFKKRDEEIAKQTKKFRARLKKEREKEAREFSKLMDEHLAKDA